MKTYAASPTMKKPMICLPTAAPGRPREYVLTPAQEQRFCQLVLLANKDGTSGSASMAWRMLCQENPDIGWDWRELASKHQLPAVARELARRAQALVAYHRQGERGLRSNGISTRGMLRRVWDGTERLLAGEHVSFDDGTMNCPVVIPWKLGGCKLSEKYRVKLGRFQLLTPHCEATSKVPSYEFVIRESQGYRGPDAGGAALRFGRDVCMPGKFYFEGGVWQGRRMQRILEGMGAEIVSVKGRPWQKLIENFYNRMWTRLAMCEGLASVGRFRGEEKEVSEFYVKCRAGNADPRGKFPWLQQLLDGIEESIRWLNADRIESPIYGKWVPDERWEKDMQEHPRPVMEGDKLWLAAPVMEKRRVTRNGISVKTTGPLGLKLTYHFTGHCLWEWEGKDVEIYFDPLAEWPLHGMVALPGRATPLGRVECCNPYYEGGQGADVARSLREVMRREYRLMWGGGKHFDTSAKESTMRGTEGVVEIFSRSGNDQPAEREKNQGGHAPAVLDPRSTTVAAEPPFDIAAARMGSVGESRAKRGDVDLLSAGGVRDAHVRGQSLMDSHTQPTTGGASADRLRSIGRKAAEARNQVPNW